MGELSSQQSSNKWRHLAIESSGDDTSDLLHSKQQARSHLIKSAAGQRMGRSSIDEMCSIWGSAWLVILLLCLALVLIGLLITNCFICCTLKADEDGKLPKRRSNGKLSPTTNSGKQADTFEQESSHDELAKTGKERRTSPKNRSKCIDYDNSDVNYSNYVKNYSHEPREQLKRSHRYHDAQLAGRSSNRNNTSKKRNEQLS